MKTFIVGLFAALALFSCAGVNSMANPSVPAPSGPREMLKFSQWEQEAHAPGGFEFTLASFTELDSFTAVSDETKAERLVWDRAASGHTVSIVRTISLRDAEKNTVDLRFSVEPTARRARGELIRPYDNSSVPPINVRNAADFDLQVGAVALVRQCPTGISKLDAEEIFEFVFIRYNVECFLKKSEKCTLKLHGLAQRIDAAIVEQGNAAPVLPEATFQLVSNRIDTNGTVDGTMVEVSMTFSTPQHSPSHVFFARTRAPGAAVDEDGNSLVGVSEEFFGASTDIRFEESNAGGCKLKAGASARGDHKIGVVVWGPALWPRILTSDLTVT